MGKALAEAFAPARDVFDEVDAALGQKLTNIIWNSPGCVKSGKPEGIRAAIGGIVQTAGVMPAG
jgi:hypothetical protein